MTYPGTTREIRFGDVVQILGRESRFLLWIGRITAQTNRNENEFEVTFGTGDEFFFTADQFQWVGSPRTK